MSDRALTAIAPEEFASLLETVAPLAPRLAVAVSGGPDSMALAFCMQRWNRRPVIALIVDHALRPESADEAAIAKRRLEKIGVAAEIMRWEHAPVAAGIHEAARTARYSLLLAACRRHNAADLLLAHHRDDQAETILMRLMKGSGIDGLAGIAAARDRDGVRLLRPFLSIPKARLVATCAASDIPFVTDPSNASAKFARGRLREIMPALAEQGLTVDALIDLGRHIGEAADAIDRYARDFLREAATIEKGHALRLGRAGLAALPRPVAMRALSLSLRYIHNDFYPPERGGLAALLDAASALFAPRTFYGCLVSAPADSLLILREPSAVSETVSFRDGDDLVWDKRWQVSGRTPDGETLSLRALGNAPHALIGRIAPRLVRDIPQGRVRATLPSLWRGAELCAIPAFDEKAPLRLAYRKQAFP